MNLPRDTEKKNRWNVLPNVKLGILLLACGSVGLFIEYIWREIVGRTTVGMLLIYNLMIFLIMSSLFFLLKYFAWHWTFHLLISLVGGYVLGIIVYQICGIIFEICNIIFRISPH